VTRDDLELNRHEPGSWMLYVETKHKLRENCPFVKRSLGLAPSQFERGISKVYDRVCIVGD
jgi:hypothetical protein